MGSLVDKKFTWVIKNFSSLQSEKIYSDQFVIDGCKWHLKAIPQGNENNSLSLYLEVADSESLPSGWKRFSHVSFTVVNHFAEIYSIESDFGYRYMLPLDIFEAERDGYVINGEVMIVAVVEVLDVVGILDVPEESEEATQTLKSLKINDDGADLVDVNGFQIPFSQADLARRVFEVHPETALECRTKNQELRTSYMNVLFSLIKMLSKWPEEHSEDDLSDAKAALAYMKSLGFKLDWLEKKLDEVKENQQKCARLCQMEQELHDLEQKCNDLRTLVINGRAEIFFEATQFLISLAMMLFDDLSS